VNRTETELAAIGQCVDAFERVDKSQHNRMLMYLLARFGGWEVPEFRRPPMIVVPGLGEPPEPEYDPSC